MHSRRAVMRCTAPLPRWVYLSETGGGSRLGGKALALVRPYLTNEMARGRCCQVMLETRRVPRCARPRIHDAHSSLLAGPHSRDSRACPRSATFSLSRIGACSAPTASLISAKGRRAPYCTHEGRAAKPASSSSSATCSCCTTLHVDGVRCLTC